MTKTSILMATASIVLAFASNPLQAQTATAQDCQSILQAIANAMSSINHVLADAELKKATAASEQALADAANRTWQNETTLWHSASDGMKSAQNPNTQKLFKISATTHLNAALSARASYDQHMQKAEQAAALEKDDYEMVADISQHIEQLRIKAAAVCAAQNMISQLPQNPGPQIPGGANNGGGGLNFPPGGALGDPLPVDGPGNQNGLQFPSGGALGDPLPGNNGGPQKKVSMGSLQVPAAPQQNNALPNFGSYYASQRQMQAQTTGNFLMTARAKVVNAATQTRNPASSVPMPDPSLIGTAAVTMPASEINTSTVPMSQIAANPGTASVTINPAPASPEVPCPPMPVQTVSQRPVSAASVPVNNTVAMSAAISAPQFQPIARAPAAGMGMLSVGRRLVGNNIPGR